MTFFGLKEGQDLENRAAHPHHGVSGGGGGGGGGGRPPNNKSNVPPPPPPGLTVLGNAKIRVRRLFLRADWLFYNQR